MTSEPFLDAIRTAPVNPSDPYERRTQTYPTLTDEQVERAAEFGVVEALRKGSVLFERGDRRVDFFIVLEGFIEIYEHTAAGPVVFATHTEKQFTGDVDLLNNRQMLVGARMGATGRVIRTRRAQFRRLLVAEPDIAEIIMRAFILRRVGLMAHAQAAAILIGSRAAGDTLRIHRFLDRNGYPVRLLDPDGAPEAREMLTAHGLAVDDTPVVILAQSRVLKAPTNRELASSVGEGAIVVSAIHAILAEM